MIRYIPRILRVKMQIHVPSLIDMIKDLPKPTIRPLIFGESTSLADVYQEPIKSSEPM